MGQSLSYITSRCGNVTLMALLFSVVGLTAMAFTVTAGQAISAHQVLRDALANAAYTVEQRQTEPTAAVYYADVQTDLHDHPFQLTAFQVVNNQGHWKVLAAGAMPVQVTNPWFTGPSHPLWVYASTP